MHENNLTLVSELSFRANFSAPNKKVILRPLFIMIASLNKLVSNEEGTIRSYKSYTLLWPFASQNSRVKLVNFQKISAVSPRSECDDCC